MPLYSISKLSTYENCPRRYAFHYIEKPAVEEFEGIEAFMGSRVHESLERLYNDVKLNKILSEDELIDFYNRIWQNNYHDKVRIVKEGYTADNYRDTGEKSLKEYYKAYYPFDDGKAIGIEKNISFKLDDDDQFTMRGVIDRLVYKGGGRYEIHDYKTSGHCPTQDEIDRDRQLATYQIGIQKMYPDAEDIELVWHYLIFGKEFRSRRDRESLVDLAQSMQDLVKVIENDHEFAPVVSALCDWCEYKGICPAWGHISKTELMTPEQFNADDGVKLVDQLAAVSERIKLLEAKKQSLTDILTALALKNKLTRITGHSHIANITINTDVTFPKSGEPDRMQMETMIKQNGLWDELSQLSSAKLKSGFRKRKWNSDFISKIEKYASEVVKPYLRLTKKAEERE